MKVNLLSGIKIALFSIPFLMFSCSDDPDPVETEPKVEVVEEAFEVNAAFEDLDLLTLDVLQSIAVGARTASEADICASTVVDQNLAQGKISIDFGAGCTSPNGVLRKGKILISFSPLEALVGKIAATMTLESYEVDGLKIEGTKSISGTMPTDANRVAVQVTIKDGKITWPDDTSATYTTTQTRVVTLGDTGSVSITGTAAGKSREGIDYTAAIKEALIVNLECARTGVFVPSIGKMDFDVLGMTFEVTLGDGNCDKSATVTYPGGSKEVTLD